MFRNITLGQYYPADSVIHRLDPRVKLLGITVYIACVFIIDKIAALVFPCLLLVCLIRISRIPFRHMVKGLRGVLILMAMAAVFNLFAGDPKDALWHWWILTITRESILRACFFVLRLALVVLGSSLLTYTTTPTTLTSGLEKVFSHLRFMHFPAHELAMMMSIALRFIPILAEEANKIMNAQLARGADLETGGILKRVRGVIPTLIPLFVSAFKRASDLATAMEARCYHGGEGRTRLYPLQYQTADRNAYWIILFVFLLTIGVRIATDHWL